MANHVLRLNMQCMTGFNSKKEYQKIAVVAQTTQNVVFHILFVPVWRPAVLVINRVSILADFDHFGHK